MSFSYNSYWALLIRYPVRARVISVIRLIYREFGVLLGSQVRFFTFYNLYPLILILCSTISLED